MLWQYCAERLISQRAPDTADASGQMCTSRGLRPFLGILHQGFLTDGYRFTGFPRPRLRKVSDPEYGQRCWTPMTCGRWLSRGSTGSLFSPLTKCLVFGNQSKRGSRTARTRHRTDYLKHQATRRSREAIGRAKLLWSFTLVRIVLHGLRRSRLIDLRLGGQTAGRRGICHLPREYPVARTVRLQRRPVS